MNIQKKVVIIAGPNGAGKTSFAREVLPKEAGCPVLVNADLIGQEIILRSGAKSAGLCHLRIT